MYTIGEMVRQFKISRSTLLYYDKIGLLSPSARSEANYRLYTEQDKARMTRISLFKEAGLPLEQITELLAEQNCRTEAILEQRLGQLNNEISKLRSQQQLIVKLLGQQHLLHTSKVMNKDQWVAILRACGMSDDDMKRWHIAFEQAMPQAHQDFLESLGIDSEQIKVIRAFK